MRLEKTLEPREALSKRFSPLGFRSANRPRPLEARLPILIEHHDPVSQSKLDPLLRPHNDNLLALALAHLSRIQALAYIAVDRVFHAGLHRHLYIWEAEAALPIALLFKLTAAAQLPPAQQFRS